MPRLLQRAALVAALAAVALPATALATTGTGHQNPDLLVLSSLKPSHAGNGDTVTATACVKNTTARSLTVRETVEAVGPTGPVIAPLSQTLQLAPGQNHCDDQSLAVGPTVPRGRYTLTVTAKDARGKSKARSHTTVA